MTDKNRNEIVIWLSAINKFQRLQLNEMKYIHAVRFPLQHLSALFMVNSDPHKLISESPEFRLI